MMYIIATESENKDLGLNIGKTEALVNTKKRCVLTCKIKVNVTNLTQVSVFKSLGTLKTGSRWWCTFNNHRRGTRDKHIRIRSPEKMSKGVDAH